MSSPAFFIDRNPVSVPPSTATTRDATPTPSSTEVKRKKKSKSPKPLLTMPPPLSHPQSNPIVPSKPTQVNVPTKHHNPISIPIAHPVSDPIKKESDRKQKIESKENAKTDAHKNGTIKDANAPTNVLEPIKKKRERERHRKSKSKDNGNNDAAKDVAIKDSNATPSVPEPIKKKKGRERHRKSKSKHSGNNDAEKDVAIKDADAIPTLPEPSKKKVRERHRKSKSKDSGNNDGEKEVQMKDADAIPSVLEPSKKKKKVRERHRKSKSKGNVEKDAEIKDAEVTPSVAEPSKKKGRNRKRKTNPKVDGDNEGGNNASEPTERRAAKKAREAIQLEIASKENGVPRPTVEEAVAAAPKEEKTTPKRRRRNPASEYHNARLKDEGEKRGEKRQKTEGNKEIRTERNAAPAERTEEEIEAARVARVAKSKVKTNVLTAKRRAKQQASRDEMDAQLLTDGCGLMWRLYKNWAGTKLTADEYAKEKWTSDFVVSEVDDGSKDALRKIVSTHSSSTNTNIKADDIPDIPGVHTMVLAYSNLRAVELAPRLYEGVPVAKFIKKEKIVHQREWLERAKKKYPREKVRAVGTAKRTSVLCAEDALSMKHTEIIIVDCMRDKGSNNNALEMQTQRDDIMQLIHSHVRPHINHINSDEAQKNENGNKTKIILLVPQAATEKKKSDGAVENENNK